MDVHYLNNIGSRWIVCKPGTRLEKVKVRVRHCGIIYIRTPKYFAKFGKFTIVLVSINGKKVRTFDYTIID